MIGRWLQARGCRDKVVLASKVMGGSKVRGHGCCMGHGSMEGRIGAAWAFAWNNGLDESLCAPGWPSAADPCDALCVAWLERTLPSLSGPPNLSCALMSPHTPQDGRTFVPANRTVPPAADAPKPRLEPDQIFAAVAGSLRRLQTDYIDLLQLHW